MHSSYKQVETISDIIFLLSLAINGPALSEFEENDGKTLVRRISSD
jgi:cytochrome c peroxidase